MEEHLRKVIQRKRAFLRKYLVLTASQVTHLRDLDLVTAASYDLLMTGDDVTHHVIDHLSLSEHGQPERFLHFLKDEVTWIHEELTSELRAETLRLSLDDHVTEEAAALIHRHFGRSRRFSERDKKMMTSLVATRSQVAKEVWKRRLGEVGKALEKLKDKLKVREDAIRAISDVMDAFLQQNQAELYDFSRDMKSTSQILLETGYGDAIDDFFYKVTSMLDRFRRVLFEKESLVRQKRLCMKVLERSDVGTALDKMVVQKVEDYRNERMKTEAKTEALKTRLGDLHLEVRQRDMRIARLRQEVEELRGEMGDSGDVSQQAQRVYLQQHHNMTQQFSRLPIADTQTDKMAAPKTPETRVKFPHTSQSGKIGTTNATTVTNHPLKSKSAHSSRYLMLNVK